MGLNEVTYFKECKHRVIWGTIKKDAPFRFTNGYSANCHICGQNRTVLRSAKENL